MKSSNDKGKAIDEIVKIIQDFQYNDELSEKYKREILDQDKMHDWPQTFTNDINISTLVLINHGGLAGMGIFRLSRRAEKQTHKDLHYLHSLSLQHDRSMCNYLDLSLSPEAYSSRRSFS